MIATATRSKRVAASTTLIRPFPNRAIMYGAHIASPQEQELVELAIASYSHCLRASISDWSGKSSFTFDDFAAAIEAVYDHRAEPRTALVTNALRQVHRRMHDAQAKGVILDVPLN